MDPWSITTASQTSWPPFISDFLAIFLVLLSFYIVRCILWTLNEAIEDHNNSEHHSFFSYIHCSWFSKYKKRSFQNLYTFVCLYWKAMLLPSYHPNLSFCSIMVDVGDVAMWWSCFCGCHICVVAMFLWLLHLYGCYVFVVLAFVWLSCLCKESF